MVYLFQEALLTILLQDKALAKVHQEYADYANVFLCDLAIELPENTGINKYAIGLIESKQQPYKPIYSLSLVKLETLKTYIKTHLKTGFIRLF